MSKKDQVTILKVAETAGVSKQTVSRVINDHPDVAEVTRKHVQQVIDELGYHPSAVARSLTSNRTRMLAVVTAGLDLVGPSRVLNGIALETENLGYTLLLKNLPGFIVKDYQALIRYLIEMRVEGVIWAVPDTDNHRQETIEKLSGLPMPVVFQGSAPVDGALYVTVDNYDGGCQATRHLVDQGFQRIAHISGPLTFWDAKARKAGWHDTLEKIGANASDSHWAEGDWGAASGAEAVSRLLVSYPEMDAIFVANDQMAIGAIQKLQEHGLHVPRDIAVIGYDNIPESAYNLPSLSTIAQDFRMMGTKSVELLVEAINTLHTGKNISSVKSSKLAIEIITRESSIRKNQD